MPWQMAPPLIIIAGAFTLTGLGLRGIDNLFTGRVSSFAFSCTLGCHLKFTVILR